MRKLVAQRRSAAYVGFILSAMIGASLDAGAREDVLTSHGNRQRTGWHNNEKVLSPTAVSGGAFGKLWETPELDGTDKFPARFYASPLYVDGLRIRAGEQRGKTLRIVVVASSTGFVYAVNAREARGLAPGAIVWKTKLDSPCVLAWDASAMGVLSTPIIDRSRETLYVSSCGVNVGWQVYALDLSTGAIREGWPVSLDERKLAHPSVNRNLAAGSVADAKQRPGRFYTQRGALNLSPDDRHLYITLGQARGWLVEIDVKRGAVTSAFSATPLPDDSVGGIWASTGPAIDSEGNVYVVTGASGSQREAAPLGNWSQSVLMFAPPSAAGLTLRGTYTPFNYCQAAAADIDLGSSGIVLVPHSNKRQRPSEQLLSVAGKQGNAYLLSRSLLLPPASQRPPCSEDPATDQSHLSPTPQLQFSGRGPLNLFKPYSETDGMLDRAKNRATPAYFRDGTGEYLFFTGNTKNPNDTSESVPPSVVRVRLVRQADGAPYLRVDGLATSFTLENPGPAIVSSRGDKDAVIWIFDENARRSARLTGANAPQPKLYAIDPKTLEVLWKTARGELQTSGKYNSPTIAAGNVFIATDRVVAFGLRQRPRGSASNASLQQSSRPNDARMETRASEPPMPQTMVAQEFPPGPNSELVQQVCTQCHVTELVTMQRRSSQQWADTVKVMVNLGLIISEADFDSIVAYLAEHFGPADSAPTASPKAQGGV